MWQLTLARPSLGQSPLFYKSSHNSHAANLFMSLIFDQSVNQSLGQGLSFQLVTTASTQPTHDPMPSVLPNSLVATEALVVARRSSKKDR